MSWIKVVRVCLRCDNRVSDGLEDEGQSLSEVLVMLISQFYALFLPPPPLQCRNLPFLFVCSGLPFFSVVFRRGLYSYIFFSVVGTRRALGGELGADEELHYCRPRPTVLPRTD